jgi:L,D-peptidoglycan transpeptidase YkuD (ErfK/YbiS/YcfS/YnhG family)
VPGGAATAQEWTGNGVTVHLERYGGAMIGRWHLRRLLLAVVLVAGLTGAGLLAGGYTRAAAQAAAADRQLITVTAASYTTTYATFTAYHQAGGRWIRLFGPWTARIGYNGMARPGTEREGSGHTPSGTYGFGFFFGVDRNPGVRFPYRHAYPFDVWDDDPSSRLYNEWVDGRLLSPGKDPEPMHNVPAYDYSAVIAYNTARTPGLGSAIFLHVGTGTATGGCVSLPAAELLKVLRWLNPARSPQIRMGVR